MRIGWPGMTPRFTAAALSGHSAIGLALSALIYLVCLTGVVSVFADELKLVEQPTPAAAPLKPGALNKAIAAGMASGGVTSLYAIAPIKPRQRLTVNVDDRTGRRAFFADADGALTPQRTPFTDFVTDLHMTLTMPAPWGALVVGLAGAALLSLILSGVLSHPRILRDAFRLRLGGSERLTQAELHNRLSVWGLPFHIVVTLSGALFGLSNLAVMTIAAIGFHGDIAKVYAPLTGPESGATAPALSTPDIEGVVARATSQIAASKLYYVVLQQPGAKAARIAVEVTAPLRLPRGEDFYFDGAGRPTGRGRFATGSLGMQAYSGAAQLHFGAFGGLPIKLAYLVLGCTLTFVSASGVSIWLARQADRGAAKPRLHRAWRGWTWGCLAALACAAGLSPVLPVAPVFWIVTVAIQIVGQAPGCGLGRCNARASFAAFRRT